MTPVQVTARDLGIARALLDRVLLYQRRSPVGRQCVETPCGACADVALDRVAALVAAGRPIDFLLPGFPTKCPNPAKVIGVLPDLAEDLALRFLSQLCADLEKIYAPGAGVIIGSEGRAFEQLIKVPDRHITVYRNGLRDLIGRIDAKRLRLLCLEDVAPGRDYAAMRDWLDAEYGEPLDDLRHLISVDDQLRDTYQNIARFLVEDVWSEGYTGNRSALQRDARKRAYGVLGRGRAWSRLLDDRFPDAVRLSSHPQPCGSGRLGMLLAASTDDVWLTPWHAVAVRQHDGFTLMKRAAAEAIGARLVLNHGRPSHYELPTRQVLHARGYLAALQCAQ
ncbi:hypothetical protein D5S17_06985 [Pseudonocardiaceae bacterium YIM PH 21723]|nr:hypothetical protein D5S17_06985 [Pseudonocardiaceae bacterium YIM PH 21723]